MLNSCLLVLAFSLLQNLDNFAVAAAYEWKGARIPRAANFSIAALSALASGLAVLLAGFLQQQAAARQWPMATEGLAKGLLVMIACWSLASFFRRKLFPVENARKHDRDASDHLTRMTFAESLLPGVALAVDNLGPSFAFALLNEAKPCASRLSALLVVLTFVLSLAAIRLGQAFGRRGGNYLRSLSPELAFGCMLLMIVWLDPGDRLADALNHPFQPASLNLLSPGK